MRKIDMISSEKKYNSKTVTKDKNEKNIENNMEFGKQE